MCLALIAGCSGHGKQSSPPPIAPPTLTKLVPNSGILGSTDTLTLTGTSFVAGASINTPTDLYVRNLKVNSPTQITADFAIASNATPGSFEVAVKTPGGTSEPGSFAILAGQSGSPGGSTPTSPAALPGAPGMQTSADSSEYEVLDIRVTSAEDTLDVSFTDSKGQPGPGAIFSDEQLTDDDPDDSGQPGLSPNTREVEVNQPNSGEYILRVEGSKSGSFDLKVSANHPASSEGVVSLEVPTCPGSVFELRLLCQRAPFTVDVDSGGLEPPHGAFSFAQPLTSEVRLPSEEKPLAVGIYYDPAMDPSSFRALLDGADQTKLFHVRLGELDLVSLPMAPGQHHLNIQANNEAGLLTEQEFHVLH